jgi:hypothetical protein
MDGERVGLPNFFTSYRSRLVDWDGRSRTGLVERVKIRSTRSNGPVDPDFD